MVNPSDAKRGSEIGLTGEGLVLELLNAKGKVLQVGHSVQDPSGALVQAVQLPTSATSQVLLVRVGRLSLNGNTNSSTNAINVRFSLGVQ